MSWFSCPEPGVEKVALTVAVVVELGYTTVSVSLTVVALVMVIVGPGFPVTRQEHASLTALEGNPSKPPLAPALRKAASAALAPLAGANAGAATRFALGKAEPVYVADT